MFFYYLLIILFIVSSLGYILSVIKEKMHLKENIILLDNKHVTQNDLDQIDMNEFILYGSKIKTGDEIKIITKKKNRFNGTIIGAKKSEKTIHLITHKNKIIKFKVENISDFKIISKYGSFF